MLKGHYIYWNSDPAFDGKYGSFTYDVHILKNISSHEDQRVDAFVSIHNLFNSAQYPINFYMNPGRWIEAGVRYAF